MSTTDRRQATEAPRAPRPRHGFTPAVLAASGYRRLWGAGLLYYHAYWFEIIVTGWVVLVLTGSPFAVGLVGFCRMLPMLVLGLVLGALADRLRETTLLLAVQVASALAALLLALLFAFNQAQLWQICLLVALVGCGWTCDFSARRALVARLHGPDRAANALSLETMSMHGSKIVATTLGGVILATGGPELAYAWLLLIYLAGIAAVASMRRLSEMPRRVEVAGIPLARLVRLGWSTAVRTPLVRAVLLVTVAMNLLVFPYQQIIAVIADDILAVGAAHMGLLAGADGIGAIVVAGLLTVRSRPARQTLLFLGGAASVCVLLIVLVLSRSFALSLGVQITLGACAGAFAATQSVLILNAVEPELRARAMGMLAMAIGTVPFGIFLAGALSATVGPTVTLSGMALLALTLILSIVVCNWSLLAAPRGGHHTPPAPRDA